RLMVAGAENKWPEGPVHLEAAKGVNELFGVGGAGLSDARRERFHRQVANDRTEPRIVVVALLITSKESLVLGRIDLAPRIAGDDPAGRRFVLERIEIFRLTAQQIDHNAILKGAATATLAYKYGQVAAEQGTEDGIGLGIVDSLRHGAGIDLTERRRLIGDELD